MGGVTCEVVMVWLPFSVTTGPEPGGLLCDLQCSGHVNAISYLDTPSVPIRERCPVS